MVVPTLGLTYTGAYEMVKPIADALDQLQADTGLDVDIHVDAASGGFLAPFCAPDLEWDFRLPRVKSISTSGHKFGLAPLGVGWVVWRDVAELPDDLIFHVNYLGGDMPVFQINFSRPAGQIVAQYYDFLRLGREGYRGCTTPPTPPASTSPRRSPTLGPLRAAPRQRPGDRHPVRHLARARGRRTSASPSTTWPTGSGSRAGRCRRTRSPATPSDIPVQRILVRQDVSRDLASLLHGRLPRRPRPPRAPPGHGADDQGRVGRLQPPLSRGRGPIDPRPSGSIWWDPREADWWVAACFAIGSTCFILGATPGYVRWSAIEADGSTYFIGSHLLHDRRLAPGPGVDRGHRHRHAHPPSRPVADGRPGAPPGRRGGRASCSSPAPSASTQHGLFRLVRISLSVMRSDDDYTTDGARRAAARGDLEAWVRRFLSSPGSDNVAGRPARGVDLVVDRPRELPLDQLNRLAGPPGDPVLKEVDEEWWRDDVDDLAQRIEDGFAPAPVIATWQEDHLKLEDGNHRVEALRRAGCPAPGPSSDSSRPRSGTASSHAPIRPPPDRVPPSQRSHETDASRRTPSAAAYRPVCRAKAPAPGPRCDLRSVRPEAP